YMPSTRQTPPSTTSSHARPSAVSHCIRARRRAVLGFQRRSSYGHGPAHPVTCSVSPATASTVGAPVTRARPVTVTGSPAASRNWTMAGSGDGNGDVDGGGDGGWYGGAGGGSG